MAIGKLLTSKVTLTFLVVVLLMVCIFLGYAISRDAKISISKDRWLTITPKGNERIKELEERLAKLEEEHHIVSSKYARILKVVGADMKDGDNTAMEMITLMSVRSKELERDVKYSLSVIRTEVYRNRTINTQSLAMDQTVVDLYIHIQKFLRAVGIYNGQIDGDQAATCSAVRQFQAEYGLDVDGIIGEKTLAEMERVFKEAKSH